MLEVFILLEHGGLINVVVGSDAVVVSVFGKLAYVFGVVTADIHVKENHVVVHVLLAHEVLEVLSHRNQRLGQAGFEVPRIQGKVEDCNPGVAQAIGYFRTEQTAIGADVDPESFSCRVVKHLVCELRAQKGFPAHQSKHAAAAIM